MGIGRTRIMRGVVAVLRLCAGTGLLILSLAACGALENEYPVEDEGSGAGSYYVSPAGDDEDDGRSADAPFRTIERALEVAGPGATVHIRSGVYHEALVVEDEGDSDRPITIQGVEDGAILDGRQDLAIGLWLEGCAGFIVENLEIRNYTDIGIGAYESTGIEMRDLVVHNNGFAVQLKDWELEGYGIHVDESEGVLVEGSDVYENGPQPRPWGVLGTGINTYKCVDCIVRDNWAHDNTGGGILVEDGERVLVEGNQVTGNYLDATEDEWWDGSIWIDGGHSVTVTNNVFRDNVGPGIQISDEDDQQPYGYVLEGNTSTGNTYGLYIWNFGSADLPSEGVLRMTGNQISGNSLLDVWIVP